MKANKLNLLNIKSNSVRIYTPQRLKIINNKLTFPNDLIKTENITKRIHIIPNKTNYNSFKYNNLALSPTTTLSNISRYHNEISQCLLVNNRYCDYINTETIPSINCNNFNRNSRNNFTKTINSYSLSKLKSESIKNKFDINLINTEELTKISTLLSSFKSAKKTKRKKNYNIKKYKFNSLLYLINKNTKLKDNEIQNRYRPIIKDFFGKKDYVKFASKSEKFIKPQEIKMLYKDTKLIKSIFDYLNDSFSKIRYHQAQINQKIMNELLEKKKKEKYYYNKKEKEKNLPLEKFFQIKKIIYEQKRDKLKENIISFHDKKI